MLIIIFILAFLVISGIAAVSYLSKMLYETVTENTALKDKVTDLESKLCKSETLLEESLFHVNALRDKTVYQQEIILLLEQHNKENNEAFDKLISDFKQVKEMLKLD